MKAIVCEGKGGPEVLKVKEVDIPRLLPNEVLIKVEATALNRADLL
jgi:NADPH:quinone reductase-like Zn-dependent oxidoreductase